MNMVSEDLEQITTGMRRSSYVPATPQDAIRYESLSAMLGNEAIQLEGSLQFEVLHVADLDDGGRADFLDVWPIGSSPTDAGAISLVQDHHAASGDHRRLWVLRGAGRDGMEIHAGYGHGLNATTRYRILMMRTRSER